MIIGVTGHRDVEQEPGELLAFARLSVALMVVHSDGPLEIITGMAQGWDLTVARAAFDLGVPYVAAVPFPDQPNLWKPHEQVEWAWAIKRAARVETVGRLPLNISYIKRDRWIVDQCDELWALDSGRPSGSHTTVLYADEIGRIVRGLWEPWTRFRAERN